MAAFKQHVTVSTILGVGYTLALTQWKIGTTQALLAGGLCAASGMLPDLDSPSGKPIQLVLGIAGVAAAFLAPHRLQSSELTPEKMILLMAVLYLAIRFGAAWLFKHITVHRGMFHSLPAAVIAAEIAFLLLPERLSGAPAGGKLPSTLAEFFSRWAPAVGVLLGYLSHLILDEIYAVDVRGVRIRLNRAAGSAMKLASKSIPATLLTWTLLGVLTYLVGVQQGYLSPIQLSIHYPG
jgi:hypothetical protein